MNETLDRKQVEDLKVLIRFVEVYCGLKHKGSSFPYTALPPELRRRGKHPDLCPDCAALVEHGIEKRIKCPLNPKPSCKKCRVHCYSKEYRDKVREIMAFSGRKLILRGRLDYLWHYFI